MKTLIILKIYQILLLLENQLPKKVDTLFEKDIDFDDVTLKNLKIVEINYQPDFGENLTPKIYVDDAIDEPILL